MCANVWLYDFVAFRNELYNVLADCISDLNEQMIINSTTPFLFCVLAKIAKQNDSIRNRQNKRKIYR